MGAAPGGVGPGAALLAALLSANAPSTGTTGTGSASGCRPTPVRYMGPALAAGAAAVRCMRGEPLSFRDEGRLVFGGG
jgi:hypothetical protein